MSKGKKYRIHLCSSCGNNYKSLSGLKSHMALTHSVGGHPCNEEVIYLHKTIHIIRIILQICIPSIKGDFHSLKVRREQSNININDVYHCNITSIVYHLNYA